MKEKEDQINHLEVMLQKHYAPEKRALITKHKFNHTTKMNLSKDYDTQPKKVLLNSSFAEYSHIINLLATEALKLRVQ